MRKRDAQVIAYSYNNLNRETLKDIPSGTTNDVYSDYDPGIRRLLQTDPIGYEDDFICMPTSETIR